MTEKNPKINIFLNLGLIISPLLFVYQEARGDLISMEGLTIIAISSVLAFIICLLPVHIYKYALGTLIFSYIDIMFIENYAPAILIFILLMILAHKKYELLDEARLMLVIFIFVFHVTALTTTDVNASNSVHTEQKAHGKEILVHIVLDEWGAFSAADQSKLKELDLNLDEKETFQNLGGKVYKIKSNSNHTKDSLIELFGLELNGVSNDHGLYSSLALSGHNIFIYQSTFLNFCIDQKFNCKTYSHGNHLSEYQFGGVSNSDRMKLFFVEMYKIFSTRERGLIFIRILNKSLLGNIHDELGGDRFAYPSRSIYALKVLDMFESNVVREAKRGDVYFLHLLLPHGPYVLDQNCNIVPVNQWGLGLPSYARQRVCIINRVAAALERLQSKFGNDMKFIVHGDHGHRRDNDDNSKFMTLLATNYEGVNSDNSLQKEISGIVLKSRDGRN